MGRAVGAHDAATLPAVVPPEQEGEVGLADGADVDVVVRLPLRKHDIARASSGIGTAVVTGSHPRHAGSRSARRGGKIDCTCSGATQLAAGVLGGVGQTRISGSGGVVGVGAIPPVWLDIRVSSLPVGGAGPVERRRRRRGLINGDRAGRGTEEGQPCQFIVIVDVTVVRRGGGGGGEGRVPAGVVAHIPDWRAEESERNWWEIAAELGSRALAGGAARGDESGRRVIITGNRPGCGDKVEGVVEWRLLSLLWMAGELL